MNRSGAACFCENKPATPKVGYFNSKLVCKSPILRRSVVRAVVGAVQRHRRPGTTGRVVSLHSVPPAPSSNPKRVAVVPWPQPSPLTYTYIHTYIHPVPWLDSGSRPTETFPSHYWTQLLVISSPFPREVAVHTSSPKRCLPEGLLCFGAL